MLKYKYFAQPINNLVTNQTILYELLLRQWDEEQRCWQIPATFELTPAELIQLLDCAIKELNNHHVSINLTARQFANPAFQVAISRYVHAHLLPRELTVELVATPALSDLRQLSVGYRAAGVLLAFDDVGSDNLFQQIKWMLPYVNTVKFALQNMRPLGTATTDTIVATLKFWFDKAEEQQMLFTFEGIESAADVQLANHLGITRGQGYYFSKPQLPVTFMQQR
ncbi:EAL domain-containing protein [Lactiplantibacillus paraplantarum]|nr:EAL domain-containing protein [Lactiplantibacillus paraplantarum]ERL45078.1 diguanylate cyclase/phosphodiesterase domain 2 containing protein [Lactiplantibacillus paraplantarum]KRL49447.1 diguanylate cyclase phosphodiesterase domain 2 containing protein [Lactiplantibacillus paraplantarum DSM 10667]MCU4682858.1 EAL domain-containing protein [Lactiplantibacillus paraplantarum]MDL2061683.1 EAL domain-containing protein [Lactiplantibacillus paraplantarum]QJU50172.1 hypothetical protein CK401_01